jgi:hypothetical protein
MHDTQLGQSIRTKCTTPVPSVTEKLRKLSNDSLTPNPSTGSGRLVATAALIGRAYGTACAVLFYSSTCVAFRTASDTPEFAADGAVAVAMPPLAFELVEPAVPGITTLAAQRAVIGALSTWLEPACMAPSISFLGITQIDVAAEDGRNTIGWVEDWSARGFVSDAASVTIVQYSRPEREPAAIVEADIFLNASMAWSAEEEPLTSDRDVRDLQAVLTHELGHAIGLLHPCEIVARDGVPQCTDADAGTAMHPAYSPTQRHLARDDVDGACFLYPRSPCTEQPCPTGELCTPVGCRVACADGWCSQGEVCGRRGCVARSSCTLAACEGQPCAVDADCASSEHCLNQVCTVGANELGDPCAKSIDCRDGACVAGYCGATCWQGIGCPEQSSCDTNTGVCHDELFGVGHSCETSSQCRGRKCLQEDDNAAICTRECSTDNPCPRGWSCKEVQNQRICAPEAFEAAGGGCATTSSAGVPGHARWWLVPALFLIVNLYRAQRYRTKRRPESRHDI